ncbi:type II toxin-antitoxin system mRNA interferase toxin, RelE/StbE family [bacterium]|nr:type II toxin-antitoxin system mRNA interferase toxin, RelE/StbE family [bacterium]
MIILYSPLFKKKFLKLQRQIQDRFADRLEIFIHDTNSQILKNHKLHGRLEGYFAFSITGDYRAIYRKLSTDVIKLVDIGTHNQVY